VLPAELIRKKRDGGTLDDAEIRAFIAGVTDGTLPDYQQAAMLMAIFFRGLDARELATWADAMTRSGDVINTARVKRPKIDKHSTGGVGDKISIPLAPAVAACGVAVPMVSGRGLGHTGGTLDKLESIPGFRVDLPVEKFAELVDKLGVCLIGQTARIAPADKRLYALRDVTATVESIPLITASILSKKLAEDIDGLVLDVKAGSGAFLPAPKDAQNLARSMVDVCRRMKTRIVAIITDMEQPLGCAIGNALEIRECIAFLNGEAPEDLETVSFALAAQMIRLGGHAKSTREATRMAYEAVSKGAAAEKFRQIIRAHGGDDRVMDNPDLLPQSAFIEEFRSRSPGFVTRCDAKLMGLASNALGAGRHRVDDMIDPAVGILLLKKTGDRVDRGDVLCRIHWNNRERLKKALPMIEQAYEIKPRRRVARPLIHAVLEG